MATILKIYALSLFKSLTIYLFTLAFTLSNFVNPFPRFVLFLFDDKESPVAKILDSHRQMLRTLARNQEKFEFWDNFPQVDENISTELFFQSKELKSDLLSGAGSHWFAKNSAPIIKKFLSVTLEKRM